MSEFHCDQLEDALREDDLAAARLHAAGCLACRRELEAWDAVTAFGATLQQRWDAPGLWPRIRAAVIQQPRRRAHTWSLARLATSLAGVALLAAALWLVTAQPPAAPADRDYLTDAALGEVQRAEDAYVRSIEQLARIAGRALVRDNSGTIAAYREKLLLLDAAITEAREAAAINRLNAGVQTELVSLYREKQQTLREVILYAQSNAAHL